MTAERALLDALLARYWAGAVTQAQAAKLVDIRRDEFVELAELRLGLYAFEAKAMRLFMAAFHELFPECDRRASYRKDCGFRKDAGIRQYTDDDLLAVPNRDRLPNESTKIESRTFAPREPRAPSRDTDGIQSFDKAA